METTDTASLDVPKDSAVERKFFRNRLIVRFVVFLLITGAGFALDLASKNYVFQRYGLPGASEIDWLIPNIFGIQTSLNEGALFGMGEGQTALFIGASAAAILAILAWLFYEALRSRTLTAALGLISAGILGNLWDRLALHGIVWPGGEPLHAVRDWILVMIGSYHWPNFNLADSFLVSGTILVAFFALFFAKKKTESDRT